MPAWRAGLTGLAMLAAAWQTAVGAAADGAIPAPGAVRAPADAVGCAGTPEHDAGGHLRQCELAAAATLAGQPLPPGTHVSFGPDGVPDMAVLSRESPVYGQRLPSGTTLHFRGGQLHHFWLPADTQIQGHLVRGQDDGAGSRMHPNGRLLAIWLAQDEVIDRVPCTSSGNFLRMGFGVIRLGTQRMAWFRPDGRLQQCLVSRDFTLDGYPLRKGDVVSLDADGHVDPGAEKLFRW
jgi:hypothetical protein